ncbi:monofunctional biosynthetic peptidoglycan transglycosylase [Sphingomonas montanisoli]|uniref:Biosynthetic peptidoglycan transglycosylase n=1 Tax=Sphingomonas montanisoli TaxID=2606412 RepID=A0A5D9CEM0_9SPHN|nr:monofunctional biosynthetic peptidoglycan transglycosylase [Sphingomonas montanisoli]TZG28611.1 monofunctional biosynthetic peptidoglycan transglycosylase [Sphingomonas montanisoli]
MAKRSSAPRRSFPRRVLGWIGRAILIFVTVSVLWVLLYRFVPPPVTVTMIANSGGGRGITKDWMSLSTMDRNMPLAALAAEDGNFCTHNGFDFKAIQKALASNIEGERKIRGGSTISQQTAKNAFLFQGGGYVRKGLEAYFTVLIELIWGKQRIMEVYLNIAETGIGTYGANAGAMRYFHHDASRLSRIEAARIAAVLPLPKKRGAIAPSGFTRRYGDRIARRIGQVDRYGFANCLR